MSIYNIIYDIWLQTTLIDLFKSEKLVISTTGNYIHIDVSGWEQVFKAHTNLIFIPIVVNIWSFLKIFEFFYCDIFENLKK